MVFSKKRVLRISSKEVLQLLISPRKFYSTEARRCKKRPTQILCASRPCLSRVSCPYLTRFTSSLIIPGSGGPAGAMCPACFVEVNALASAVREI